MRPHEAISDEDLILHYYGESDRREELERELEASVELEHRYIELRRVLEAVRLEEPPTRSDLYGHEVWKKVYPRLGGTEPTQAGGIPIKRIAAWALAASLLLVVAFWAGRQTAPQVATPTPLSEHARSRILLVSVADHLEKTQILLVELANASAQSTPGELDVASQLKSENRIFRQAAQQSGEPEIAFVLEELELFLTELAHLGPDATDDLNALLARLEDKNLLFKVRVLGTRLEERTRTQSPIPTT